MKISFPAKLAKCSNYAVGWVYLGPIWSNLIFIVRLSAKSWKICDTCYNWQILKMAEAQMRLCRVIYCNFTAGSQKDKMAALLLDCSPRNPTLQDGFQCSENTISTFLFMFKTPKGLGFFARGNFCKNQKILRTKSFIIADFKQILTCFAGFMQ